MPYGVGHTPPSPIRPRSRLRSLFYRLLTFLLLVATKLRQILDGYLSSDDLESEYFALELLVMSPDAELGTHDTTPDALGDGASVVPPALFDVEPLRAQMEVPGEPFLGGPALWETRRQQWLAPAPNMADGLHDPAKQRHVVRKHQTDLTAIPREQHVRIYELMVENAKRLRQPMSLRSALYLLNIGWAHDLTWEKAGR